MEKAKGGYLNSFVFNFDSKAEVVNRMMNYDYHGLPEDHLQQQENESRGRSRPRTSWPLPRTTCTRRRCMLW